MKQYPCDNQLQAETITLVFRKMHPEAIVGFNRKPDGSYIVTLYKDQQDAYNHFNS